jgi:hypothetical protein
LLLPRAAAGQRPRMAQICSLPKGPPGLPDNSAVTLEIHRTLIATQLRKGSWPPHSQCTSAGVLGSPQQAAWLPQQTLLMVLEAEGQARSRCQHIGSLMRASSWSAGGLFSLCPHIVESREGGSKRLLRTLIPPQGLRSHDLITSPWPHL